MTEQTLYRYWKEETLLYVGISVNAYHRAKQHSVSAKWWQEADRMTMEHYSSREEVAAAEVKAIRNEKPLYNKTHQTGHGFKLFTNSKTESFASRRQKRRDKSLHLHKTILSLDPITKSHMQFIADLLAIETSFDDDPDGFTNCLVDRYRNAQAMRKISMEGHLYGGATFGEHPLAETFLACLEAIWRSAKLQVLRSDYPNAKVSFFDGSIGLYGLKHQKIENEVAA